jgi:predicted phosphodiesterase
MGLADEFSVESPAPPKASTLGRVADLLERNGIDVDEVGRVHRINLYQTAYKDADGEAHIVDLQAIQLSPKWADGPAWPVVQQATPTTVKPVKVDKPVRGKFKTCVVLPDPQIGFRRDMVTGELDPFHDEKAMGVALKIVRAMQPDLIVNLGDTLDLAEMSSFRKEAGFALTTQATIDRAHLWIAEQRANAPHAEIRVIEGNHDRRLLNYITDNAKAAFGLRQANTPDAWPVLSVPFLLRLEELAVSYVEGYPAGVTWINDRLACIHGERLKTSQVVDEERVSVIQGHTHHVTRSSKTRRVASGARTSLAVSPGCLCRIDGAVPSTKGSTDSRGRAIMRPEDWQQAVAVVRYEEGDGTFAVTLHDILDGWCMVDGQEYTA